MAELPNRKIVIGEETESHISIRITERMVEDHIKAEVILSFPFLNGTCNPEFKKGEFRTFASDIESVERTQTGVAKLTLIPNSLVLNLLFDEKRQLILAIRYRRNPALGVDTIFTLPVNPAELPALTESLRAVDLQ